MHSTVLPQEVYYLLRAQISVLIKLTSLSALSRAKILKTFAARNPRKKKKSTDSLSMDLHYELFKCVQ